MKPVTTIVISLIFVLALDAWAETWSSIESEHFVVMFTRNKGAARDVQKIAEGFYPKVTKDLGYVPRRKISIWFCESQKHFNRTVNAPIQDWAAGAAYPLHTRIVIRDPASGTDRRINLEHLVEHEITHVIFGLYVGQNLRYVPVWFNEGLAVHEAGQWTYSQHWIMLTGTLSNSLIPLYELAEDFPRDEFRARIAYAQSCSVVTFMVRKYGSDSLRECIRLLAEGRKFDEALVGAIGIDSYWLEKNWRKHLKSRYKWISLISSWVVLWGFVIFIGLLAYLRQKAKNRRILRKWEEEEALLWKFEEDEEAQ